MMTTMRAVYYIYIYIYIYNYIYIYIYRLYVTYIYDFGTQRSRIRGGKRSGAIVNTCYRRHRKTSVLDLNESRIFGTMTMLMLLMMVILRMRMTMLVAQITHCFEAIDFMPRMRLQGAEVKDQRWKEVRSSA